MTSKALLLHNGCTANFVWSTGSTQYLGAAGHCFIPQGTTATHGPGADFDASGVLVSVCVNVLVKVGLGVSVGVKVVVAVELFVGELVGLSVSVGEAEGGAVLSVSPRAPN